MIDNKNLDENVLRSESLSWFDLPQQQIIYLWDFLFGMNTDYTEDVDTCYQFQRYELKK